MTSITSPHNSRLKSLRRLRRGRERDHRGLFLVEGEDLIEAAAAADRPAVEGYKAAGVAVGEGFHEVDASALATVSTLGSGTRAIGVYEQRWSEPRGPLCVYLHGVGDPGNVGTVLRSVLAFGASCVAFGPDCADPHSPKAVRASMGAIFSVSLARVGEFTQLPGERIALVAHDGEPIRTIAEAAGSAGAHGEGKRMSAGEEPSAGERELVRDTTGERAFTLLVGAERDGLPQELVDACEHVAHIPIASESLNAAMAATVALYEMTRASSRVPAS